MILSEARRVFVANFTLLYTSLGRLNGPIRDINNKNKRLPF